MTAQTFEFQSDYARRLRAEGEARGRAEGEARGRAEGEARALLAMLAARGFDVPEEIRARITGCSDAEQMLVWAGRAATIRTLDELFD